MLAPALVILSLKIAVSAVTLLLIASLIALAAGSPRWHGRINRVFFALTILTVIGFEVIIRFVQPNLTASFSPEQREALNIHLCFSVPAALMLPAMLYTGTRRYKTAHIALAIVFSVLWIGTVVTGVFFLPHSFDAS
ncbi:MAG TPA: hypothetical protein VHR66_07800 [Gemmataceae bacterium]|jgi:hypothetical protein|nr:hypothetical protein [Gemmataceae bacterium]